MVDGVFPVDWNAFHFLRSHFLWLLVPVGFIFLLGMFHLRQDQSWKKVIAPHLRPYVIKKGSEKAQFGMQLILILALSFGVLGLAGPTWKKVEVRGQELETPVVILLDLSQSMMATDLQPSRLERAKFKINDLLKLNPQARVALVGFAGTAHTIVPLTKDYEIISSHIDGLTPSVMPIPGSDLEAAFNLADSLMAVTEAPGTILLLTDDLEEDSFAIIQNFSNYTDGQLEVIPMNTAMGAEVPLPNSNGFYKNAAGETIHSQLDPQWIGQMSSLDRVTVHSLTLDESDMELISKKITDNLVFTEVDQEKEDTWQDMGLLFVIPMTGLLLLWFRKGWVIYTLLFFALSSCTNGSQFAGLWYTLDYQGQKLSDQANFEKAAERFDDPMRKGIAYFKAGNFKEAISNFQEDTTAYGTYNLGLAYFESGDTLSALLAFQTATNLDPEFKAAKDAKQLLQQMPKSEDSMTPQEAEEAGNGEEGERAQNQENDSMEDLGGGGQEATEEDMQTKRKEETVTSDVPMGQELEEVPEDIQASIQPMTGKMLMRKVDEDPSLFLKRKFEFQVKEKKLKPKADGKKW